MLAALMIRPDCLAVKVELQYRNEPHKYLHIESFQNVNYLICITPSFNSDYQYTISRNVCSRSGIITLLGECSVIIRETF